MFGAPFADGLAPDDPQWLRRAVGTRARPAFRPPVDDPDCDRPDAGTRAPKSQTWRPAFDLLSSQAADRAFVAEVDDNGQSWLRFGDGDLGAAPAPSTAFAAKYRVGNGASGNVPAGSITRVTGLPDQTVLDAAPRPQPAAGLRGFDPEPIDEVKLFAPGRSAPRRARGYGGRLCGAGRPRPGRATRRRHDPIDGGDPRGARGRRPARDRGPDPALIDDVKAALEPYRRIGHDLRVVQASYVAVDLALSAGVQPDYLRGHVEAALLRVFSAAVNPDG